MRHMTRDRRMWAVTSYFRQADDPEVLVPQALVAALVYRKPNLAEQLLVGAGLSSEWLDLTPEQL